MKHFVKSMVCSGQQVWQLWGIWRGIGRLLWFHRRLCR